MEGIGRSSHSSSAGTLGFIVPITFLSVVVFCVGMFAYENGRASGLYKAEADAQANAEKKNVHTRIRERCFERVGLAWKECAMQAVDAARDRQRSEYDLQAQREAARWAWWAAIIAGVQVPVSIFGLLALLRSLDHTKRSLEEAKIANELVAVERRPHLIVENRGHNLADFVSGNERLKWHFAVVNYGKAPAFVRAMEIYLTYAKHADVDYEIRPRTELFMGLSVGDGIPVDGVVEAAAVERHINDLSRPDAPFAPSRLLREFMLEERAFYFFGSIEYEDFYGGSYKTAFGYVLDRLNVVSRLSGDAWNKRS